jgi:hypothetical protein
MRPTALTAIAMACALGGASVASCNGGAQADPGTDAYMQVSGAQFVRGPMPTGSKNGPAVEQLALVNNNIWASLQNDPIGGALAPTATAAAIGLRNDVGYWVVPAGPADVSTPTYPSFGASASFSTGIILGSYTLVAHAIDGSGNFGPPTTQILVAENSPLNPPATGDLVVTLTWDSESNLNLHVFDPTGAEIWWGDQSSMPATVLPVNQPEGGSYGYIDYDSNANCLIDGLRREDAIWPNPPPPGKYTVRIDTASLCGQPIANWTVRALLHGKAFAQANGVSLDADTWGSHGAGSGQLAMQFTVP